MVSEVSIDSRLELELLVDLDLSHESAWQIKAAHKINPRFSDLKLHNYILTSEIHPSLTEHILCKN